MTNALRIAHRNHAEPNTQGKYVLYWMQIFRRLEFNHALQYAVELANKLGKPLLIYEGLRCDYPWASERFHRFLLEGMCENAKSLKKDGHNYFSFVERKYGDGRGLMQALCEDACAVVTDDYPAFVVREHNARLSLRIRIPFIAVDSNGILPLQITQKAPYSAFHFRRIWQKNFVSAVADEPMKSPLSKLKNRAKLFPRKHLTEQWPDSTPRLESMLKSIAEFPIDHQVQAVLQFPGTRAAALQRLRNFVNGGLLQYAERHNDPDFNSTSLLSPYLHFGKISTHEIVKSALNKQPAGWSLSRIRNQNGSRDGFLRGNPSIEAFLDQAITWREIGFHYCYHDPQYDRFESLPRWARATLQKHAKDVRDPFYTLRQFESAQTHDPIWNAAQRQLLQEGIIHNYLRMLWGKKILEWSPDPQTALHWMIELNNKYALDGRDPNSYSGIFWIFGRFDRPWAEREIFGTVRYMSSTNTARKVKLKEYLRNY